MPYLVVVDNLLVIVVVRHGEEYRATLDEGLTLLSLSVFNELNYELETSYLIEEADSK